MDTVATIERKNLSSLWNNGIFFTTEYPRQNKTEYVLYSTGQYDLSGRKYCAIPKGENITPTLRNKYHIMM